MNLYPTTIKKVTQILPSFQVENTLSTYEPHACAVVYSAVDRSSFQTAEETLAYLWRIGYADSGRTSIILVANKVDLERSRVIPQEGEKCSPQCHILILQQCN